MKKFRFIFGLFLCFLSIAILYMTIVDPKTSILEGTLAFGFIGVVFIIAALYPGEKLEK